MKNEIDTTTIIINYFISLSINTMFRLYLKVPTV